MAIGAVLWWVLGVAAAATGPERVLKVRADAPSLPVVDVTLPSDLPAPVVARALERAREVLLGSPTIEDDEALRSRIAVLPPDLEGWRAAFVSWSLEVGPASPVPSPGPVPDRWPQGPGTGEWVTVEADVVGPWHVVRLEWSDGTTDRWSAEVFDAAGAAVALGSLIGSATPEDLARARLRRARG